MPIKNKNEEKVEEKIKEIKNKWIWFETFGMNENNSGAFVMYGI